MKILSIDPGKSGAICLSDYSNGLNKVEIVAYKMPMLKNGKDYDVHVIKKIITKSDASLIVVEDVHSIFGSSARSNFVFGFGVGLIRGMVETSNIPYQLIHPKTWQKEAWQGISKVKDAKLNSQAAAHRLFPLINFKASNRCTTDHDGIIDATLLGYYAFLKFK